MSKGMCFYRCIERQDTDNKPELIFCFLGLKQQCLQECVALRLPQQHSGRTQLPDRPFLRPLPFFGAQKAEQEASTQLLMPPLLQQGPLYQRLPSGKTHNAS